MRCENCPTRLIEAIQGGYAFFQGLYIWMRPEVLFEPPFNCCAHDFILPIGFIASVWVIIGGSQLLVLGGRWCQGRWFMAGVEMFLWFNVAYFYFIHDIHPLGFLHALAFFAMWGANFWIINAHVHVHTPERMETHHVSGAIR